MEEKEKGLWMIRMEIWPKPKDWMPWPKIERMCDNTIVSFDFLFFRLEIHNY